MKIIHKAGFVIVWLAFLVVSCGSPVDKMPEMDLMQYGLPVKIKAPEGAEVQSSDLGFVKDVTIKGGENYYVQIVGGTAATTDAAKVKQQLLQETQQGPFFDELIQEDEHGFIFRKKISEDHINHDFRFVRIQGDMEYVFQTGLMGNFSLEEVELMYEAIQ